MSVPTDIELMAHVRDGDISQVAPLFERHHVRLYNFYIRLTGQRQLSEDLVQEVFFRILKYRHTFRGNGEFVTWMYHVARNVHYDHRDKWKREDTITGEQEEWPAEDPSAHDLVERTQQEEILQQALAELEVEKRELLILSRFQGLRYDAIAEILGCSTEAVKVRMHRAVNELRTIYFRLSGEEKYG